MVTCQVSNEKSSCVSFHKYWCPLSFLFVRMPPYEEWGCIDVNFGTTWTLSIRESKNERRNYLLWDSFNTGNINTSRIYADSILFDKVTLSTFFWWSVLTVSDLVSTKWTRAFCRPLWNTLMMKYMSAPQFYTCTTKLWCADATLARIFIAFKNIQMFSLFKLPPSKWWKTYNCRLCVGRYELFMLDVLYGLHVWGHTKCKRLWYTPYSYTSSCIIDRIASIIAVSYTHLTLPTNREV